MKQNALKLTDLAAGLVFALFALCICLVVLTGAEVYGKLADRRDAAFSRRTAAGYLTTRVRQADASGLTVEDFEGRAALVLREQIDGEVYLTRIYCSGGMLRELFTPRSAHCTPEDGQPLLEAEKLEATREGGLLKLRLEFADGTEETVLLYLHSEEVLP